MALRRKTKSRSEAPTRPRGRRRWLRPFPIIVVLLMAAGTAGAGWLQYTYHSQEYAEGETPEATKDASNDAASSGDGLKSEQEESQQQAAGPPKDPPAEVSTAEETTQTTQPPTSKDIGAAPAEIAEAETAPVEEETAKQVPTEQATVDPETITSEPATTITEPNAVAQLPKDPPKESPLASPAEPAALAETASAETVSAETVSADADPPATDITTAGAPRETEIAAADPAPEIKATAVRTAPASSPRKPAVAVILTNLGLSPAQTQVAIENLPPQITLAFAPYGRNLQKWAEEALESGHEVLLEVPMEPLRFPENDPGPHALLTSLPENENAKRLKWLLDRFTGYTGIISFMGSRFTASDEHLRPMFNLLRNRNLVFVDARSSNKSVAYEVALDMGLPAAMNDRFLDVEASHYAIQKRLEELQTIASQTGQAVGIGYPYPTTLELIAHWSRNLAEKNIELVPISAIAARAQDNG